MNPSGPTAYDSSYSSGYAPYGSGPSYGAAPYGSSGSYGPPQPPATAAYNQPSFSGPSYQYGSAPQGFNVGALCSMPSVRVKQQVEAFEVATGYESSNRYGVYDPSGNLIIKCKEKSSTFSKLALGAGRSMDIFLTDAAGNAIMQINRPFKLWHKNVTVTDASGRLIGSILKKFALAKAVFHVFNGQDQQMYTIQGGPMINIGKSRKLSILNSQGVEVGSIVKEWAGLAKELFTDADNFSLIFPADASAEARAILIAATLFIDLTHFEK